MIGAGWAADVGREVRSL